MLSTGYVRYYYSHTGIIDQDLRNQSIAVKWHTAVCIHLIKDILSPIDKYFMCSDSEADNVEF